MQAKEGNFTLKRGKLEVYDLEIMVTPEDLLFFANGEKSTLHILFKKNRFGYRKLRFLKGSNGKQNLSILLKLPKIIVC